MARFCKKDEYCALKTSLFSENHHLRLCSFILWDYLWLAQRRDFDGGFSLRCSDWSMSKIIARIDRIRGKLFYRDQTGCRMSKIVSKIKQNFVWICWNLFNLDEKVIWSLVPWLLRIGLMKNELWALLVSGSHSYWMSKNDNESWWYVSRNHESISYHMNVKLCTCHWIESTLNLRGYCTPGQFLDCFCIFFKNYNTLVTSKICFL